MRGTAGHPRFPQIYPADLLSCRYLVDLYPADLKLDSWVARVAGVSCPVDANARNRNERDRVGLCSDCEHARRMQSDRGSVFFLCHLSFADPDFPKYPRLPVVMCAGYQPEPPGA